jgi:hypothetical protein
VADVAREQNRDDAGTQQAVPETVFIALKSITQRSYARDLRLRDDDVIAAIDGVPCHLDIIEFENMLLDALDDETALFVTIARDQMFFEIFIDRPLGVTFEYTVAERAADISQRFADYAVGPKEQYQTFEALRDIRRHVTLYSTAYSGLATICPPLWLIQHRALEPLAAVVAAYAAAAAVHWVAFVLTVLLIAIYFHRIQFRIIRNYNIFTEHFYWVVCAARTVAEAQKICREIDPKCTFSFSYVGPPQDTASEDKKAARQAARRSE